MVDWHLDMSAVWLTHETTFPILVDVAAYGSKGGRTLTVATGTGSNFGNYASGKIWSLLTWNNEPAEVLSVAGDVLTLKKALNFDTIKARHGYIQDVLHPYRIVKIYSAQLMEDFNTDIKPDQESTTVDESHWKRPLPTTFFDMDIGVGRTLTVSGHLLSDNRRSAEQYRDALWNIIRQGWVRIVTGRLDDYTGNGVNVGMIGYIIKNVKIVRKSDGSLSSGKTPASGSYSRDDLQVTVQLIYAPKEGLSATDKELVEVA